MLQAATNTLRRPVPAESRPSSSPGPVTADAGRGTGGWAGWLTRNQGFLGSVALLCLLAIAVFEKALWFPLGEADDLRILSSAARTENPLVYFAGDWGMGQYRQGTNFVERAVYRPLHTASIWAMHRAIGISAYPNQLINLLLHVGIIVLLLRILGRVQSNRGLCFLLAALGLVSIYTVSPASWVSDRSTLVVGACLFLLVDRLMNPASRIPLAAWIVGVSIPALLSKESGMIVPLFGIGALVMSRPLTRGGAWGLAASVGMVGVYGLLRIGLFGARAVSYSESGYLFGVMPYEDRASLEGILPLVALLDNIVRNIIAVVLPMFSNNGELQPGRLGNPTGLMVVLGTLSLFLFSLGRRLSLWQKYALLIIVLNALLHLQVFRYRVEYLSQLAFCLFIASAPALQGGAVKRILGAQIAAVAILAGSLTWVNFYIHSEWHRRFREINEQQLTTIVDMYPLQIDPGIAAKALDRYRVKQ